MNIKEQIVKILKNPTYKTEFNELPVLVGAEYEADQILDLVLNALTIEKKEIPPTNNPNHPEIAEYIGYNKCVDAYEVLKTKLKHEKTI